MTLVLLEKAALVATLICLGSSGDGASEQSDPSRRSVVVLTERIEPGARSAISNAAREAVKLASELIQAKLIRGSDVYYQEFFATDAVLGIDIRKSRPVAGDDKSAMLARLGLFSSALERSRALIEQHSPGGAVLIVIQQSLQNGRDLILDHPLLSGGLLRLAKEGIELFVIRANTLLEPDVLSQRLRDPDFVSTASGALRDRWARTPQEIPIATVAHLLVAEGQSIHTPLAKYDGSRFVTEYQANNRNGELMVLGFARHSGKHKTSLWSPSGHRVAPARRLNGFDLHIIKHQELGDWKMIEEKVRGKKPSRSIFALVPISGADIAAGASGEDGAEPSEPAASADGSQSNLLLWLAAAGFAVMTLLCAALAFLLLRRAKKSEEPEEASDESKEETGDAATEEEAKKSSATVSDS